MLIIRLQRVGRKNDPSFRVVVVDSHSSAKTGKVIEVIGNYNARQSEPVLQTERINDWITKGAQISDTVHNLLVKKGIIKERKINVASKKLGKKAQAKKPQTEADKSQASASVEKVATGANPEVVEEVKVEEEASVVEETQPESPETPAE